MLIQKRVFLYLKKSPCDPVSATESRINKMGASCTTAVLPNTKRMFSLGKAAAHDFARNASQHHHLSLHPEVLAAGRNGKHSSAMKVEQLVAVNPQYDTDDEEAAVEIKLPKFALDLIDDLDREEEKIKSENIDPILLTKIRPNSVTYEFVRENGTKQLFRAESLIDYMLTTRHFHDPETRIEFTNEQLQELDKLGSQLGKQSLYEAKLDGAWMKQKLEDDEDAFAGVERCAGDHISEMIRFIERTRKSHAQEGEMELLVRVFPFYRHYVTLMFGLDPDATMVAVDQFKRFLIGPPNRPTVDKSRVLLKFCLDFLDEVNNDLWTIHEGCSSTSRRVIA